MKIDGVFFPSINRISGANKPYKAVQKNAVQKDSLAVSDKGQFYQLLMQKVKDLPEVREDKVQDLSNQIANGQFRINAYRIAELMLDKDQE